MKDNSGLKFMTLVRPRGEDLLIVKTSSEMNMDERRQVNEAFRRRYPSWTGLFLVLHKDQTLSRMPENMARDVYYALKKRFEPEPSKEVSNEGTVDAQRLEGASGPGDSVHSPTHDSVG